MSIYKKIAAFAQKFEGVEKKRENTFYNKSKYANLDDVINAAKPLLIELGLVVTQPVKIIDGKQILVTIVHDIESGESIESSIDLDSMTDRKGAQGYGSAMTYARRYSLCSLLGIVESDDDDGNIAQGMHKQEADYLIEHNTLVRNYWGEITEIKTALSRGDRDEAMRYWNDMEELDKHKLWRAPTKGGIFTTEERDIMKGIKK